MKFHIITIFPKSFTSYFDSSILKRAIEDRAFEPIIYNLCDYSVKNTRRVDDRPFWWFPWTIFSPLPLANAIRDIQDRYWKLDVIYMSPRWKKLNQQMLEKFAKKPKDYIVICGHYEWIDERIIELFNVKEISIWNYILTSWELAAMVLMDWITRLLPWVISSESLEEESFSPGLNRKKEYPQYTRPSEFEGKSVPEELLSWNPKTIKSWKNKFL
jgi:tRNA (guanine37-N1)-methyltransferase